MTTLSAIPVKVPPITQRTRIPQEAIDYVVWQIAEKFQPLKIIYSVPIPTGRPDRKAM
jgi:hypothetical protein